MEDQEESEMVTKNQRESELPERNNGGDKKQPTRSISFRKKMKNPDYSRKVWRTICVAFAFWCLGYCISQRGPAFLDLQIITQTDLEMASFFFTASSVGYLVGSLAAGVVYDKLNKSLLLLLSILGLALSTIALPWCSIYAMMITIHVVVACFGGSLDTAGNAELSRVWGTDGEMAMQFAHFMFAFGGVIGPLATEPFLTPDPNNNTNNPLLSLGNVTELNSTAISNTASNMTGNTTTSALPLTTDIHYAFLISGSFSLILAILFAVQVVMAMKQRRKQQRAPRKAEDVKQPLPRSLFLFVLLCFCLFYFTYCLIEDTFSAFLTAFVVKKLNWSKSKGALISSLLWAAFATGRFLGIFLVRALSALKLLFLFCLFIAISLFAFLLFSQYDVDWGVWLATAGIGFAMAPVFPSGFTWMEEDFMRVTGRVASSILIASSAGTMVNPIILGFLMQMFTPMWFAYLLFLESLLCLCLFWFLLALSRLYIRKHYSTKAKATEQCSEIAEPIADQNVGDNPTPGNSGIL